MTATEYVDIVPENGSDAVSCLARVSGLSKSRIKDAMTKGAVWLTRHGRSRRLRRARTILTGDDRLSLYHDAHILDQVPEMPELVDDRGQCSVWIKPAGLLCGGTRFGDHCAINRLIERQLDRPTFLVHRLDRFVSGLMVLAHSKQAAAHLSGQFENRQTLKVYHAKVHGRMDSATVVDTPVDGKSARSSIAIVLPGDDVSDVEVTIETGRKHQIRQHLAGLGHPIVGDRLYGSEHSSSEHSSDSSSDSSSESAEALQLRSVRLGFDDPASGERLDYRLDQPANVQPAK